MALKQLLELPNITSKKNATVAAGSQKKQKKPAAKDSPTKAPKERSKLVTEEVQLKPTEDEEIISVDSAEEDSPKKTKKPQKENSQNTRNSTEIKVETGIDESRSGRKRKLTEKAREHELAVKRQKVGKIIDFNGCYF